MKKKYVIFIIIVFILGISGLFVFNLLNKERELFLYTNKNKEVILWDKDTDKKEILVSNFDLQKNNAVNFRLSPNNKYIVFPTTLEEDDTYCLSYKKIGEEEINDLSCGVRDFIVTNDHIYYLKDEILYENNYKEDKNIASNVSRIYDFDNAYYLTVNGSLYKISNSENKVASLVTDVLGEYNNEVVITKNTSEEVLSNLVSALYVGETKITDTMFSYHGNNKSGLYYTNLSKDILNNVVLDKGYKNVITNLKEAKTNSNYTLYMIASSTCHFCQMLEEVLSEMVNSYGFIYNYLNYPKLSDSVKEEVNNNLTDGYSYPKLVVVNGNKVIDIFEGYADRDVIYEFLKENTDFVNYDIDENEFIPYLEGYVYKEDTNKLFNGFFQNEISDNLLLGTLLPEKLENNIYSSLKIGIYNTTLSKLFQTDLNYINTTTLFLKDDYLFYKEDQNNQYYLLDTNSQENKFVDDNIENYIYNDFLYYVKKEDNQYKIQFYDKQKEAISTSNKPHIAFKDKLYYINNNYLYCFNGKENIKLIEAIDVMQTNDFIYFASDDSLYSDLYYLDSNNNKVLIDENILLSLGLVKLTK